MYSNPKNIKLVSNLEHTQPVAPTTATAMTPAPSFPTPSWPQTQDRPPESPPPLRDRRRPACAGRCSGRRGRSRRRRRGGPRRTATRTRTSTLPFATRPSPTPVGVLTKTKMMRQDVTVIVEGSGGRCAYPRWPCWSWRSGQKADVRLRASPGEARSWSRGGMPWGAPISPAA